MAVLKRLSGINELLGNKQTTDLVFVAMRIRRRKHGTEIQSTRLFSFSGRCKCQVWVYYVQAWCYLVGIGRINRIKFRRIHVGVSAAPFVWFVKNKTVYSLTTALKQTKASSRKQTVYPSLFFLPWAVWCSQQTPVHCPQNYFCCVQAQFPRTLLVKQKTLPHCFWFIKSGHKIAVISPQIQTTWIYKPCEVVSSFDWMVDWMVSNAWELFSPRFQTPLQTTKQMSLEHPGLKPFQRFLWKW